MALITLAFILLVILMMATSDLEPGCHPALKSMENPDLLRMCAGGILIYSYQNDHFIPFAFDNNSREDTGIAPASMALAR